MLSFYLTQCTDCGTLGAALCEVEGSLAQYGKNAWMNLSYMTQKPVSYAQVKRLMYYTEILQALKWDQTVYCPPFKLQNIISRARHAADSITPIAKRWDLPVYTTTTTTTTTSTTTTSTTSTTTSTSTSTTTSTTHTTTTSTSTSSTTSTTHTTFNTTTTSTTSTTTTTTTTVITPSAWLLGLANANAFMNISQNGITLLHHTGEGSGLINLTGGQSTTVSVGNPGVTATMILQVINTVTGAFLYNHSQTGTSLTDTFTWTPDAVRYDIICQS